MSVSNNTYVIVGKRLGHKEFQEILQSREIDPEPYEDELSGDIKHHNGLCLLNDGFNGQYAIIGRVLAKSCQDEGLQTPYVIDFYNLFTSDDCITRQVIDALREQFGIDLAWDEFEVITLTHYR
jgi:hypothetical protein